MPRGKKRGAKKPQGRFIASAEEMQARDEQDIKDGKAMAELALSDEEEEVSEGEEDEATSSSRAFAKGKSLNAKKLIETANPNAKNSMSGTFIKASEIGSVAPVELSRKEREAIEEIEANRKRFVDNKAGTSEEAKSDMARLKLIREQREAAKLRKQEERVRRPFKIRSERERGRL